MQQDSYLRTIEDAGLAVRTVRENPQYHFISDSAQGATKTFGVKTISVLASKRTGSRTCPPGGSPPQGRE